MDCILCKDLDSHSDCFVGEKGVQEGHWAGYMDSRDLSQLSPHHTLRVFLSPSRSVSPQTLSCGTQFYRGIMGPMGCKSVLGIWKCFCRYIDLDDKLNKNRLLF